MQTGSSQRAQQDSDTEKDVQGLQCLFSRQVD